MIIFIDTYLWGTFVKSLSIFWKFLEVVLILPMFLWDPKLPTSFLGLFHEIEKKWEKILLTYKYIRVWVFIQKFFPNFNLLTTFQDFCLPTLFAKLTAIFSKNMRKKKYTLVYYFIEFSDKFSKNWYNLVNFLNFKMNFHTHRWVVLIFFRNVNIFNLPALPYLKFSAD